MGYWVYFGRIVTTGKFVKRNNFYKPEEYYVLYNLLLIDMNIGNWLVHDELQNNGRTVTICKLFLFIHVDYRRRSYQEIQI